MNVVGGEAERGASEVDAAEHADRDELAGALDVAHVVRHDGDERGGRDAERGHVGEGVHLDAVQTGRVQEARGEAVEHVEDHRKEDEPGAPGEDRRHDVLVVDVLVRLKRNEDGGVSAEGIAEREAVRNELKPALHFPRGRRDAFLSVFVVHHRSFAAASSASA